MMHCPKCQQWISPNHVCPDPTPILTATTAPAMTQQRISDDELKALIEKRQSDDANDMWEAKFALEKIADKLAVDLSDARALLLQKDAEIERLNETWREWNAAAVARDCAGFVGVTVAECIKALSDALTAKDAEIAALKRERSYLGGFLCTEFGNEKGERLIRLARDADANT